MLKHTKCYAIEQSFFFYNMRCFVMFVTAVCILFLLKLKWPIAKNKSFYYTGEFSSFVSTITLARITSDKAKNSINSYKNNSRHLARKYARMFVRGHYPFREANSFPRA